MHDIKIIEAIGQKYTALRPMMDERMRRQWAAAEARMLGWGGVSAVAQATGLARNTIQSGLRELAYRTAHPQKGLSTRIRRRGGGRKRLSTYDPQLLEALEALVDPVTRGEPQSPLRWTCKSIAHLAQSLTDQGHRISDRSVARLLKEAGYSLQANRKPHEGKQHPDRNAQFEHINAQVIAFQRQHQPVISVDTKKKELIGDFHHAGREWYPKGQAEAVRMHDFPDKHLGKAIPYGVYDLASNEGWVSVGITHDTARFAVNSIRRWWYEMGAARLPQARKLMITADGGGSNSSRNRLWKVALQELADELGFALHICHFPPGTSKWNKIEHRLFSFITKNWRARPLTSLQAVVELIAHTTTDTGLIVRAALDENNYQTGIKITDQQLATVKLKPADFHGNWNYAILPHKQT